MKTKRLHLVLLATLLLAIIACAPKATPGPVAAPAPTPYPTQPEVKVATTPNPEEAAWQKVVEGAKKEGKLLVYDAGVWGAVAPAEIGKPFKATYGIDIDFISGQGADILERLNTEKRMGRMVGDIFMSSTLHLVNAKKAGLTTPLSDLPVLTEKDIWLMRPDTIDQERHFLSSFLSSYPIWVNTNLASPSEYPQRLNDILSPRWKKQMIITDPNLNSALYNMMVPLINKGIVTTDFVRTLKGQEPILELSTPKSAMSLSRGEGALLVTGASIVLSNYVKEGAPIKPLAMEEGTSAQPSGSLTAVSGAPHPNAAKLFINWLFSPAGQEAHARSMRIPSIRKDVPDYTPTGAKFTPKKLIVSTVEDQDMAAGMFLEKAFPKLWKD